jgi:hypothetical protein
MAYQLDIIGKTKGRCRRKNNFRHTPLKLYRIHLAETDFFQFTNAITHRIKDFLISLINVLGTKNWLFTFVTLRKLALYSARVAVTI